VPLLGHTSVRTRPEVAEDATKEGSQLEQQNGPALPASHWDAAGLGALQAWRGREWCIDGACGMRLTGRDRVGTAHYTVLPTVN
jgi:hypothetical protein